MGRCRAEEWQERDHELKGSVGEVLKAYLEMESLPREAMPEGLYLVHNHVKPVRPLGMDGFRAWIQLHKRDLVECRCNFGNVKNAKLHRPHYRVRSNQ